MKVVCIYDPAGTELATGTADPADPGTELGTTGTELAAAALFAVGLWAGSRGHSLESVSAEGFGPCLGCFGCWLKTPGRCVIKGDGWEGMMRSAVGADLVVFVGPTPYGCFSSPIKAVLDRWLPTLLPFFRRYRGEMHHVPRYSKRPRIVSAALGGGPAWAERGAEDETHLELVRSFCDNAACPRQKRFFRYRGEARELADWLDGEVAS